jgi:mono/diheme cytochrome c family protein
MGFAPDALWFPPLVEVLIAVSIVYMAVENIIGAKLERRWMVAFGFGLVHGFGFSYALREQLQFAGAHLLTALAAFNIGIELAQLLLVALAVPVLSWCFNRVVSERVGSVIISVLVAHTAWHWMTARFEALQDYRLTVPAFDVALAVSALRLAMGLLVVGAAAWALSGLMARLSTTRTPRSTLLLACAIALSAVSLVPRQAEAQGRVRTTMAGVYTADQATKGKEVFQGTCSGCHTVASHSGELFAARWMGKSLNDFYDYVSRLMPKSAPGTLSEDEYVWVTAYVLKLNGMPASSRELSAEPALLKAIRIDSMQVSAGGRSGGANPHGARLR